MRYDLALDSAHRLPWSRGRYGHRVLETPGHETMVAFDVEGEKGREPLVLTS